jgi:selenide,water dikinase
MRDEATADLVLVGGGHAHVQILRRWMMAPLPGVRLSVVLDRPVAVYSGMVPGFAAGEYAAHELEIDVVPLARRARARVLLARATRIDPVARRIEIDGRVPIAYDVASLDVGSSVRGLELPGVVEHVLATRPIGAFVAQLDERLRRESDASRATPLRVAVVGAGAAGVELALTLAARLGAADRAAQISVLSETACILADQPARVSRRARRAAERRGVRFFDGRRVARVEKDAVYFEGGGSFACDWIVWATGAAPHAWLAQSPLPHDDRGFVRVGPTLQVVDHPDLFAVGDCVSHDAAPWVRKAGVYAVRQGPVLDANLRARLRGRALRAYRPQRDFLALLNLGAGEALGAKWGVCLEGGWVWRWKDWIDRRFMRRFQVLAPDAGPASAFPDLEQMDMGDASCGGCAAKLGAAPLGRALRRLPPAPSDDAVLLGLDRPDDAAAVMLPRGDVLLASVDAFRAFADDPWLVGRVAAVNAMSDVFATGAQPRHALALVTVAKGEEGRTEETLYQVLAGVRAALDPLGVSLVGGHTTRGDELFVGVTVTGALGSEREVLGLDGLQPDESLILSKALGTGVVLAADMQGLARGAWVQAAYASMLRPNRDALRLAREFGARACTDVTGFGLVGHLAEMLRASGTSARLQLDALPALDGAIHLLARGVRSTAHEPNARGRRGIAQPTDAAQHPAVELLFDPQTSGGLLFSVPRARAEEAVQALHAAGDRRAAAIGSVAPARSDAVFLEIEAGEPVLDNAGGGH